MKTRAQIYEREAALLRDISMYRVMAEKQLLLLHPGKEDKVKSLLSYLVRQGRIWQAGSTAPPRTAWRSSIRACWPLSGCWRIL